MLAIRQKKSLEIILNTISTALGSSLSKKSILLNSFALKIFKKSQNVITFFKTRPDVYSSARFSIEQVMKLPNFNHSELSSSRVGYEWSSF